MNNNDISRLSYKELQALALRYRVPGNIKKKLLVKVLQAAKGGNENEVGRLLQDLKQNRKKRVRKIKTQKLGITSTPLHSPNYVMADDYYCPQQQPPYQWVGAEEEIVSREDDGRIPHYEEFKQFLLRKIQREFQTYDTNNNQIQESMIEDLRTATAASNFQAIPIEANNYTKANIISVNSVDPYIYHSNDHVEYQTLEDSNGNTQGSILLKKMLQAPVGANLGEIASPVFGGYRLWPVEQYQTDNLLDNSDTLTAESETQDNEGNFDNNPECYGLLGGIKGEYFLNEPSFVRNVDDVVPQMNALTNDNSTQYRYQTASAEMRQSYENWTVTNVTDAAGGSNNLTSDVQSTKIFQTMYYDNSVPENLNKGANNDSLNCQYRMVENVHSYSSGQNLFHLNSSEENQYYDPNMMSGVQAESSNTYYLQNLVKYSSENTGEYFHGIHSLQNANVEQETYSTPVSQNFSNDNHYNSGVSYEYPYAHSNQEGSSQMPENLEQQQSYSTITRHESSGFKDSVPDRAPQTTNGVLDPFWPKWFAKNPSDAILENLLNLYTSKRVDLSKLDQTSCVYSYIAPIVTHTPVSSNSSCSQKERFVAEYRQHSFSPYWLLYNDTACGLRMANIQTNLVESISEESQGTHTSSNSNSDIRESIPETEDSIEMWPQDCTSYETTVEKDSNVCEDLNVEVTDCLFSVINTDPLDSQAENMCANDSH